MNKDRLVLIVLTGVFFIYLLVDNFTNQTPIQQPVRRYVVKSFVHYESPKEYEEEFEEIDGGNESNYNQIEEFDVFSKCKLTVFDPFHKEIGRTINYKNPIASCNKRYGPATKLENQYISIQRFQLDVKLCRYRCHRYVNVTAYSVDEWKYLERGESVKVECDFVRVECFDAKNKTLDQTMHTQIVETTKSTVDEVKPLKDDFRRPDIHIIVVDSVSSTQARRSLPRTLSYLQNEMKAVQFHHLNKIGDNSQPNGYAFLLGWRIVSSKRASVGAEDLSPLFSMDQVCNQYHDNDTIIFREFEKIGYKTFYSEEYIQGNIFTFPKCKGFKNREAHHLFRPFVSTHNKDFVLKSYMSNKNCFEMHQAQLEYHGKFMRAYKKKPKFGLTWLSSLAHDDSNALFHTDEHFEKLFKSNADALSNSFVIFMADHGMRIGATLDTELGQRELKNPMFLMVLPKWLRDNQQLLRNLRTNSRKLLTQFDVHATLLDIMNMTITNEFNDFTERSMFPNTSNPNNATSLLRPLGQFSERNCRNIPTDFSYCLCEYETSKMKDPGIEKGFAEFGVEEINKIFEKNGIERKCDRLKLRNVEKTIVYLPANRTNLYVTTFIAEPGLGLFKMAVRVGEGGTLKRASDIERLNSYGNQARCIDETHPHLRPLCHCNGRRF